MRIGKSKLRMSIRERMEGKLFRFYGSSKGGEVQAYPEVVEDFISSFCTELRTGDCERNVG